MIKTTICPNQRLPISDSLLATQWQNPQTGFGEILRTTCQFLLLTSEGVSTFHGEWRGGGGGGERFPFFDLRSFLTLRHRWYGQKEDSHQEHEEDLAYATAQVIQCQECNIIGREGDDAKENLEQEDIGPQVLEVESQAIKGHTVCKSVVNKDGRQMS